MTVVFKCRKCRRILIDQTKTSILNHHNTVLTELNNSLMYDCGGKIIEVWYLQETEVPEWIVHSIDEVSLILFSNSASRLIGNNHSMSTKFCRLNGKKEN